MKRDVVSIGEATLESESKRARSASCQLNLAADNDVAEDASGFGVDSGVGKGSIRMEDLEEGLLQLIFTSGVLTWRDVPTLSSVCRRWRGIAKAQAVTERLTRGIVLSFGGHHDGGAHHSNGKSEQFSSKPRIFSRLRGEGVVQVEAGERYNIALTKAGDVFYFTCATEEGNTMKRLSLSAPPSPRFSAPKVVAISAGSWHSLMITENGQVYSFGRGQFGRLGHGDEEDREEPTLITSLAGHHITLVSTGFEHSLVSSSDGQTFSFGCGWYGRCGIGDNSGHLLVPEKIDALSGERTVGLAAGSAHSLVLTASGKVYSFGSNVYGQLGLGTLQDNWLPREITSLRGVNIVAIAAGGFHNLFLTDTHELYSCGNGEDGRLGHGEDESDVSVPRAVSELQNVKVVAIAAGSHHSLALADNGQVHSFGYSLHGQLLPPPPPPPPLPSGEDQYYGGPLPPVTCISAGSYHSLIML